MTQHPEELLAEYADGTLGPEDRALVEDHLSSCATCREDAAAARRARSALRALPELEAPPGITFPAIKEARRAAGPRFTWATKAVSAAAAAVLLGGAAYLTLSIVGDGVEEERAAEAPALEEGLEEAEAPPAEEPEGAAAEADMRLQRPLFRETSADYDPESLMSLAQELKTQAEGALATGFAGTAQSFYEGYDLEDLDAPAADAIRCVTDAGALDRSVVPFLIERARFEGEEAYVAAFLKGPEPDQAYDRVQLIVVDVETCSLRYFARQRL